MKIRQARKIFLQYIYTGRRSRYDKLINAQKNGVNITPEGTTK